MLLSLNIPFGKETALPLFLGLVTDSGRFLYQPIPENAYQIAGALSNTGIDIQSLYDILYEVDEKLLRLKGFIFTNYRKTKENVAYLVLSKEDLRMRARLSLFFLIQILLRFMMLALVTDCSILLWNILRA